jgi:hypothetical protein
VGETPNQPFQLSFNASHRIDFQGSRVTSDGGLILVRELDERLGFGELIEEHLKDSRRGNNTQFPFADLLRQSVYSRLAGYETRKLHEMTPAMRRYLKNWWGTRRVQPFGSLQEAGECRSGRSRERRRTDRARLEGSGCMLSGVGMPKSEFRITLVPTGCGTASGRSGKRVSLEPVIHSVIPHGVF